MSGPSGSLMRRIDGLSGLSGTIRLFELEATPRIELGMEVLQTSALPLGYVAFRFATRFYPRPPER
jgi:hypothetical protein